MIQILHNPRCRKSRAGLEYLKSRTQQFEIIDYIKNPLSAEDWKKIIDKTGLGVHHLLRTQEAEFKSMIKGKNLSDEQIIELIARYPKLIHRPIVINGDKAVLAQPPEKIDEIL